MHVFSATREASLGTGLVTPFGLWVPSGNPAIVILGVIVSLNGTADDVDQVGISLRRSTTSGTGTTGSAVPFDPDAPSAYSEVRHSYTVDPTAIGGSIYGTYRDHRGGKQLQYEGDDDSRLVVAANSGFMVSINLAEAADCAISLIWEEGW